MSPALQVDRKLQEVALNTISYFKNTLELKKQLLDLNLPTNTRLFTADAVSMYTNIPTHMALNLIGKYLTQYQRKHNNEHPRIVLAMASSGAMVTTYSGIAQLKREVKREWGQGFPGPVAPLTR